MAALSAPAVLVTGFAAADGAIYSGKSDFVLGPWLGVLALSCLFPVWSAVLSGRARRRF